MDPQGYGASSIVRLVSNSLSLTQKRGSDGNVYMRELINKGAIFSSNLKILVKSSLLPFILNILVQPLR